MLKQRIITAVILLIALGSLLVLADLWVFSGVALLVIVLAAWEWESMIVGKKMCSYDFLIFVIISMALLGVHISLDPIHQINFWPSYSWPHQISQVLPVTMLLLALPWWVLATASVIVYQKYNKTIIKSWFGQMFAGLGILMPLFISLVSLRALDGGDSAKGALAILYLVFIVIGADVGAYAAGKTFGKTKLALAISPGKTWEGVVGGLVGAQLLAYGGAMYIMQFKISNYLLFSGFILLLSMASIVGDLFVSLQKRRCGVKDSSQLLPGHGGLLDRLDSLSAALPLGFIGFSFMGLF